MKNRLFNFIIAILISSSGFGLMAQNSVFFYLSLENQCAPTLAYFSDNSYITSYSGALSYEWWLDGTLVDNNQYPSPQNLSAGNHSLELYVKDTVGYLGSYRENVFVSSQIDTFFVKSGLIACPGEELTFTAPGDPYMIEWDFGEGSLLPGNSIYQNNATHRYLKEGLYTVTLTADNGCGLANISQDVEITPSAVPQFMPYIMGNSTICPNEEVQFNVDGNFSSYLWDFGDGNTSTKKSPYHTFPDQTNASYTVNLTVTNFCGNSNTESLVVNIDFNPSADASFNYYMDFPYGNPCPGTQIMLQANSAGTHQWRFGDGGVSSLRDPVYNYSMPGMYTIEHTITSGCGVTDVSSQVVEVLLNPSEMAWNVNFTFDINMNYDEIMYLDTLVVCPGETVSFKNQTYYSYQVDYNWDFGDGGSQNTRDAIHKFDNPGMYVVTLTATTGCGGINSISKYIMVDAAKLPDAQLGIVPMVICPNETVYFFDDNFDPKNNFKYTIDFGDGNVLNDITSITDLELQTLASHQYTGAGPFNFSYKAVNTCGNITEQTGTITVNSDNSRKPFYYVTNSTQQDQGEPTDWSIKNDATDHQLDIFVQWSAWQPAYSDTFYIYFWYGGFFTDSNQGQQGEPNGIIKFTSSNIVAGETITAWAPMNMMGPNDVGIAAGYFCGDMKFQEEPDAWGTLLDATSGNIVNSIPITPGGYTNITDVSPSGIQISPDWDGVCKSELAEGTWYREVSPGIYAFLELQEDMPGYYYYYMEYRNAIENWTESNYISAGPYIYPAYPDVSSIEFQDEGCGSYIAYSFTKPTVNQLQFFPTDDACADRVSFLDGIFEKYNPNKSMSICPGDIVDFQIAGGANYVWDFGDGSSTSNAQFPDHKYDLPGTYEAFVTATNNCGRVDVINSTVRISSDNTPNAEFYIEDFNVSRMDTLRFRPANWYNAYSITDNNKYLWEFGDGKTSNIPNPSHVYTEAGQFKVKLSVTNSCGTGMFEQDIWIKDQILLCEAKFDYNFDGLYVDFSDYSSGADNWEWDFGDGSFSNVRNPSHTYATDGVYFVKLTTYNSLNNCVSSVVRKLVAGNIICDAQFTFIVNNTSRLVKFVNTSVNSGAYFWDFGDNSVSDLPNPEHTYAKNGLYRVCLTVMDDASGCQSVYCAEILVGTEDNSLINADYSYFPLADGNSISFSDLSAGKITNWYWTTGDGKTISKSSFVYTYALPGIYEVCLIVFDENTGQSDEICKTVRVGGVLCNLTADFDFFVRSSTNEITLEDKTLGNHDKWFWTFGDGYSSEAKNPAKYAYKKPGFYLVTLSVYDATNDCMDRAAKFIQIGDVECKADFKVQIDPVTKKVDFINNSTGPIQNYYWDFGNGKHSTQKSPSYTYSKAGKYTIGLTVIDSSNVCLDYTMKEIQLGEIDCSAAFDYYVDSVSSTAYFKNRVIGNYSQMLWVFGDGTYTTKTNPVHRFTAPGYYTVSLNTFNSENNCMDYYETVILVGSEGLDCQANFIYQPGNLPNTIRFKDNSNGIIQDLIWSFGDGNNSKEINPTHNYPASGYYFACLTIRNNFGIPNMNCKWIPVDLAEDKECRAGFMFSVDSISLKAVFTDNSFGEPDTWKWDFGDGTKSTERNPKHSYTAKGYYNVKLVSSNSINGCQSSEVKLINVGEENVLKASFDYEADSTNLKAAGYPIDFVGTTSGDASSYEWDFGDERLKASFTVMDSTNKIVTHYYEFPGIYNACLRASDPISNQIDVYCETVKTANAVSVIDFEEYKAQLKVYPNPAADYTNISYNLPKNIHVEIAIFDAMGRRIETLVRTEKEKGDHQITWNTDSVRSGLYIIKLMTSEQIITQAIAVSK